MVRLQPEHALRVHSAARTRLRPRKESDISLSRLLVSLLALITAVACRWLVVFAAFHRRRVYNTQPLRFFCRFFCAFFGRNLAPAAAVPGIRVAIVYCRGWMALSDYRGAARRAGGGFVNHDLFWNVLSPWGGHPPGQESDTIQVGPREQGERKSGDLCLAVAVCGTGSAVVECLLLLLVVQDSTQAEDLAAQEWQHVSSRLSEGVGGEQSRLNLVLRKLVPRDDEGVRNLTSRPVAACSSPSVLPLPAPRVCVFFSLGLTSTAPNDGQ